jgi:hypothetical protein
MILSSSSFGIVGCEVFRRPRNEANLVAELAVEHDHAFLHEKVRDGKAGGMSGSLEAGL